MSLGRLQIFGGFTAASRAEFGGCGPRWLLGRSQATSEVQHPHRDRDSWNKSSPAELERGALNRREYAGSGRSSDEDLWHDGKPHSRCREGSAREITSHLADKPKADDRVLAIEGLRYLRSIRDLGIKG